MKFKEQVLLFCLVGFITIVANTVGFKAPVMDSIIGMALLIVVTLLGLLLASVIPFKLPNVFWISLVALLSTSPLNPYAKELITLFNKINFLAICTPILAYAGLSIGKDLKLFKQVSWQMIVVALVVYTGTFICATLVAQVLLGAEGII